MNYKAKLAIAAIAIGAVVVAASYNHTVREETRVAGLMFGNTILDIHESLKAAQDALALKTRTWETGGIGDGEMLGHYDGHLERMDSIIARYDSLDPPPGFEAAVKLLVLSAESQRQSDEQYALWIMNRDDSYKLRSDELLQDAFEYESEGLAAFSAAKLGLPG